MRKFSAKGRLEMQTATLTAELCAERFGTVLRRWTGEMRNASKRIAKTISADPRVVENYIYGRHCPPAAKLIELMAECPELADEVNRLVEERRCARNMEIARVRQRIAEARHE